MVAARVANLDHGTNRHTKNAESSIDDSRVTRAEADKMLNVSTPSVDRAKRVQRDGIPKLAEMVGKGEVSVYAASVSQLPEKEQEEAVKAGPAARASARANSGHAARDQMTGDLLFPSRGGASRCPLDHAFGQGVEIPDGLNHKVVMGSAGHPKCIQGALAARLFSWNQRVKCSRHFVARSESAGTPSGDASNRMVCCSPSRIISI